MNFQKTLVITLATILLSSLLMSASCSPTPVNATERLKNFGVEDEQMVSSPEMARDATIAYLRDEYDVIPSSDMSWIGENITSEESVTMNNFLYSFRDWRISVVSPVVEPERRVFTVIVLNEKEGFKWAGLIDAFGKIKKMDQLQPTSTPPTFTPIPTNTPLPTATPAASATSATETCNDATFIEDVTVPDGTTFPPGTEFLKVWRLRNVGSCTWTTDYELVFVGGNRISAQRAVSLSDTVQPGAAINLGVNMIAPNVPGNYRGFWMLQNANGKRFGIGDNADDSFWVSIEVVGNASNSHYDFALNYCDALWHSATDRLSCGDSSTSQNGTVQFLVSPNFENRHENEPTLWVHPNEASNGWIEGNYPAITIESGDRFKAWVGCLEGNEQCDVTFYLSYIDEDNHIYTLQRWHEVYDNQVSVIDMDLSSLAGQKVQFILGMESNTTNFDDAQGFWFVPRIER
jgi:hypothetical protein